MKIDQAKFSQCIGAGTQVRVSGNVIFDSLSFKGEEGILIHHDFNVDLPAEFDGWESDGLYIPRLKPVHTGATAIQFFCERIIRAVDAYDLEYFINGAWKTFRQVMA